MRITIYDNRRFFTFSEKDRADLELSEYFACLEPQSLDEKWEESLERRGFEVNHILKRGVEFEQSLTIFRGENNRYLALIEIGDSLEEILIDGISSLLEFLKEFECVFRVQKDYVETYAGSYIRKDRINGMQVHGPYKKDGLCKLIAYDENDNMTVICESSREYINKLLLEQFSISM